MTAPERPTLLARIRFRDAGTLLGLVLIGVVFSTLSPVFMTTPNLMNILQQSSINACIALGMTLVIISGGIDLSVGPMAALSAVLGNPLPYDDIAGLRARIASEWPHLAGGAEVKTSGVAGTAAAGTPTGALPMAVDNYYLTNPIARASETMAACVAEILPQSPSGVAEAAE